WGASDLSANGASGHAGVIRLRQELSLEIVRVTYTAQRRPPAPVRVTGDSPSGARIGPAPPFVPACLWDFVPSEEVLNALLKVSFEVTSGPYLVFDERGDGWLPQIRFSAVAGGGDDGPLWELAAKVVSFTNDEVLGAVDRPAVEVLATRLAIANAKTVLAPV